MPVIVLETIIEAPLERCFDLSRSVDLHMISTAHTSEKAVAGICEGLIGPGQSVTWQARHFGVVQYLTSKITEYERPHRFVDEMQQGIFKDFRHVHLFAVAGGSTLMKDIFDYTSPLGVIGGLADRLFLKNYMTRLLIRRNEVIKHYAETILWKDVL